MMYYLEMYVKRKLEPQGALIAVLSTMSTSVIVGWLVVLRINVDLAIFQPYLDLEAGDNQSLKIQVARPGIEPRSSCSASQELNHSATAAPHFCYKLDSRVKNLTTEWNQKTTTLPDIMTHASRSLL